MKSAHIHCLLVANTISCSYHHMCCLSYLFHMNVNCNVFITLLQINTATALNVMDYQRFFHEHAKVSLFPYIQGLGFRELVLDIQFFVMSLQGEKSPHQLLLVKLVQVAGTQFVRLMSRMYTISVFEEKNKKERKAKTWEMSTGRLQ